MSRTEFATVWCEGMAISIKREILDAVGIKPGETVDATTRNELIVANAKAMLLEIERMQQKIRDAARD